MTKKNPAAVALGRLGGSVKSKAKTKAARLNARKPRKKYPKRKIAWIQKPPNHTL